MRVDEGPGAPRAGLGVCLRSRSLVKHIQQAAQLETTTQLLRHDGIVLSVALFMGIRHEHVQGWDPLLGTLFLGPSPCTSAVKNAQ